jgi:hypothetical protein
MAKSFPNTGATVIDAVGDLPASPSEGMMVFQKDTNELKIYDGSVWVSMLDTDTVPAMELLGSNTFTSSTGFYFSNIFNSRYDNYRLYMSYTAASTTANTAVKVRLANATTQETASNYSWQRFVGYSTTYVSGASTGQNAIDIGFVDPTYPNYAHSITDLCNPFNSLFFTYNSNSYAINNSGQRHVDLYNGDYASGTSYNGIYIFPSNGNISGKALLYGIRS